MTLEQLKMKGKCCACEKSLASSKTLNIIQLHALASWKYPVWGNLITGSSNLAVAFICDECFDSGAPNTRFAIEAETEIKYHPIESLVTFNQ